MRHLYLTLPLPPSVNHSHIEVRKGRRTMRIRSPKSLAWIKEAQAIAIESAKQSQWKITIKEKVICELIFYWPDNRRRDVHNQKVLFDALNGIVYDDDSWLLPRYIDFQVKKSLPKVMLKFTRFNDYYNLNSLCGETTNEQ